MSADSTAWHADEAALRGLADGTAGPVLAASLESHLMRCETCRAQVNALAFTDSLETVWAGIRERVEEPRPSVVERLLARAGLSRESARLLAAVPAMRGSWLLGVSVAVLFAWVAAGLADDLGIGLFLLVAPLAPVAGVAAGFGGDAEPAHEIVVTTPYSAGRLLLLRTAAVLATCAPVAMLVGLVLPGPAWLAVAWLTPAAAAVAVTLLLAPLTGLTQAAVGAATTWALVTFAATHASEPLALVGQSSQVACLALVLVSVLGIVSQRHTYDLPRRQS